MANNIRLSSLAQKDIEKSFKWYEKQQPGLGEVFAEAIYHAAIFNFKKPRCISN